MSENFNETKFINVFYTLFFVEIRIFDKSFHFKKIIKLTTSMDLIIKKIKLILIL